MDIYVTSATDIGIKRKVNQDSYFVRRILLGGETLAFAVLCDGMGGLTQGEVASQKVVEAYSDWMYSKEGLQALIRQGLSDFAVRDQWTRILDRVNQELVQYGHETNSSLGTTITMMLLTKSRFYAMNVGDSRIYQLGTESRQLTLDHSYVSEQVREGLMTEEEAESSPKRNYLTRCVGVREEVSPDFYFGNPMQDTTYLLCSDGFRHVVTKDEMRDALWTRTRENLAERQQYLDELVRLNMDRGETDNITAIALYVL